MMQLTEARQIANDPASEHAPVTFDLAGTLLEKNGEQLAAQLAYIKAEHARLNSGIVSDDMLAILKG